MPVIENGGLTWGDGALWRFEDDPGAISWQRLNSRRRRFVFVADFRLASNHTDGLGDRNPVHSFDFQRRGPQGVVFAHHNAILIPIDCQHIDRLARGEAESLALADGVIMDSGVPADHGAVFGYDIAFLLV